MLLVQKLHGGYKKGFVLRDAPAHKSVEELLELSWEDWDESINKLDGHKEYQDCSRD